MERISTHSYGQCRGFLSWIPRSPGCRLNRRSWHPENFHSPINAGWEPIHHLQWCSGFGHLEWEPSLKPSWWVAVDKMHIPSIPILMADVCQGSSLESVRWYKCRMNQDQANLNNMDLAYIAAAQGVSQILIPKPLWSIVFNVSSMAIVYSSDFFPVSGMQHLGGPILTHRHTLLYENCLKDSRTISDYNYHG